MSENLKKAIRTGTIVALGAPVAFVGILGLIGFGGAGVVAGEACNP